MLVLWAVIAAALVAVALALNTSGPTTCIRSMGTACLSPSAPQHAGASQLMNLRLLAETFPHRPSAGCALVHLDRKAPMIGNTCPRANGGSGSPPGWLPAVSAAQSRP